MVCEAEAMYRGRKNFLEAHCNGADLERARLQSAHVEEVAHESIQTIRLFVDRFEELVPSLVRPFDVVLEKARRSLLIRIKMGDRKTVKY
jgi:hypothetical protein